MPWLVGHLTVGHLFSVPQLIYWPLSSPLLMLRVSSTGLCVEPRLQPLPLKTRSKFNPGVGGKVSRLLPPSENSIVHLNFSINSDSLWDLWTLLGSTLPQDSWTVTSPKGGWLQGRLVLPKTEVPGGSQKGFPCNSRGGHRSSEHILRGLEVSVPSLSHQRHQTRTFPFTVFKTSSR